MAGGVGTLIEYYDFSLYSYLAIVMAPSFFPSCEPGVALRSSLARVYPLPLTGDSATGVAPVIRPTFRWVESFGV